MALTAFHLTRGGAGALDILSSTPRELITGTGVSPKPRLRVDPGQTAFFEGRQFRTFHEFSIATGQSLFGRFITVTDVIVAKREIVVVQGNMRFALSTGGTPSGTWTLKTVFPVNTMSERPTPLYVAQSSAAFGGELTGQTELDLVVLETGTSQAVSVGNVAEEVGLGAGTYYVEMRNTGAQALRGLYTVLWEERQAPSSLIA